MSTEHEITIADLRRQQTEIMNNLSDATRSMRELGRMIDSYEPIDPVGLLVATAALEMMTA